MTARITIIAAVSTVVALASPAAAAPQRDALHAAITVSDLNLTTAADQQRLNQRIDNAARALCATNDRTAGGRAAERQCMGDIRATVGSQVASLIAAHGDTRFAAAIMIHNAG